MAVSKRLRYEILRRDNHTCRYCGGVAPDVVLTVDHVTPTALGGSDAPENLVAACKDCNSGKTSVSPDAPLVADVAQKAVEWAAAVDAYCASRAVERKARDRYVAAFSKAWNGWHYGAAQEPIPRDAGWQTTMWRFYESGLPIEEVLDAVLIACGNSVISAQRTWVYFCGVVWKRIKLMQEEAHSYLPGEDEEEADEDGITADYQAGWVSAHDSFAYNDVPYRALQGIVDGTGRWGRELGWVVS
jgi:hypothetical protein